MMQHQKKIILALFTLVAVALGVRCGNHYANECSRCVFDFADDSPSSYKGAAWCHGDCVWEYDANKNGVAGRRQEQCRSRQDGDVDCGYYTEVKGEADNVLGFFRPSCEECFQPVGEDTSGERYCGGECVMEMDNTSSHGGENRCIPRL